MKINFVHFLSQCHLCFDNFFGLPSHFSLSLGRELHINVKEKTTCRYTLYCKCTSVKSAFEKFILKIMEIMRIEVPPCRGGDR